MNHFRTLFFLYTIAISVLGLNQTAKNGFLRVANEIQSNIAFDLADLTHTIQNGFGNIDIEAFRVMDNDKIIAENEASKYNQLRWVSIGNPKLIETASAVDKQRRLFHTTQEGFYTFVQTLTESHRELLATVANFKYLKNGLNVNKNQIFSLPLSKFECSIVLFEGKNKLLINGKVTAFKEQPLRLDFWAPLNTKERRMFIDRLNTPFRIMDLGIECEVGSQGKEVRINTFSMSTGVLNQLEIVDDIFGPANSSYVTREQMGNLAGKLYSKMNIVEDYQMPEYEFKETFIDEFIKLTSQSFFKQVSLSEALEAMSKFSLDFSDDLKSDVVKAETGKILKVEKLQKQSYIKLDQEAVDHLIQSGKAQTSGGGGFSYKMIGFSASASKVVESASNWLKTNKSLSEQLSELNSETQDEVQWAFEGEKIVPKSISVSKLLKSSFSKTLTFTRIKQKYFEAPFVRRFSLYTTNVGVERTEAEKLWEEVSVMKKSAAQANSQFNEFKDFANAQLTYLNSKAAIRCITVVGEKFYTSPFDKPEFTPDRRYKNRLVNEKISFGVVFREIPTVILHLGRHLDVDNGAYFRYQHIVKDLTTTGFTLFAQTWDTTIIHSFTVTWSAHGCINA